MTCHFFDDVGEAPYAFEWRVGACYQTAAIDIQGEAMEGIATIGIIVVGIVVAVGLSWASMQAVLTLMPTREEME
jgi:hypothetical protein